MTMLPRGIFVPVSANEGESLLSLISRSAELNVHTQLGAFLRLASIRTLKPAFVPFTRDGNAEALAARLRISLSEILRRMHPPLSDHVGYVDWYGTRLPRLLIDAQCYRFSPTSLKRKPFQRASWMLKPLTFCPESMEILLERCAAGHAQTWRYRSPMGICEQCRESLTDLKSEAVASCMRESLAHVTNFISCSDRTRRDALHLVPLPFREWEAGEVFASVVELGAMLDEDNSFLGKVKRGDLSDFEQRHLLAGYAFIMKWPESLYDLLRSRVDLTKGTSLAYCAGPLSRYFWTSTTSSRLRELIRLEVPKALHRLAIYSSAPRRTRASWVRKEGAIGRSLARRKFKIDLKTLRRLNTDQSKPPVAECYRARDLFDETKLAKSVEYLRRSIRSYKGSVALGVPEYAVKAIAERGLLANIADRDAVAMAGEPLYEPSSLDVLIGRLKSIASEKTRKSGSARVVEMLGSRFHGTDWADAIQSALDHKLKIWMSGNVRFSFSECLVETNVAKLFVAKLPRRGFDDETACCRTAARLLDLHDVAVSAAVKRGLLKPVGRRGVSIQIPTSQLMAFNSTYVGSARAASLLNLTKLEFARIMKDAGISPAARLSGTALWHRNQVENLSARRFAA